MTNVLVCLLLECFYYVDRACAEPHIVRSIFIYSWPETQTLIDVIVFLEKEKINNAVLRYGKDINTILSAF